MKKHNLIIGAVFLILITLGCSSLPYTINLVADEKEGITQYMATKLVQILPPAKTVLSFDAQKKADKTKIEFTDHFEQACRTKGFKIADKKDAISLTYTLGDIKGTNKRYIFLKVGTIKTISTTWKNNPFAISSITTASFENEH